MMGYVHQVRSRGGGVVGGTRDCFATSFSSLLFSVVFIQCYYDVTTSPSPSDFNPNPFVMSPNPIYASASGANRDPYPTPLYQAGFFNITRKFKFPIVYVSAYIASCRFPKKCGCRLCFVTIVFNAFHVFILKIVEFLTRQSNLPVLSIWWIPPISICENYKSSNGQNVYFIFLMGGL